MKSARNNNSKKVGMVGVLLLLTLQLQETHAFLKCALQFFQEDKEDWKKLGSGYLLGLHSDQVNDQTCNDCEQYGNNMALINYGLVTIEQNKDQWLDKSKITSLNVLQIMGALMQVYMLFIIALVPIDSIITNQQLMSIPGHVFGIFQNKDAFIQLATNVLQKSTQMAILIVTLPGADCHTIGYRVGAFERFLFGIVYTN